ncbi:MAG: penicillin-binding protein 2 [Patescibacteria group bacterium]|nr:penicillin-binding protein 2 [Patescibacteria group bacterium]
MAYYQKIPKGNTDDWLKRINILMGIIFVTGAILLIRLFQQGVIENSKYVALAKDQHTVVKNLEPKRGEILTNDFADGEKYPLATNIEKYDVNVIPKNVKNKEKIAEVLSPLLEIGKNEIFDKINNDKLYIPPLKKKIEKDLAQKIMDLNLEGVVITSEDVRYYPEGDFASQLLGFVNAENIGNYGIEGYYDSVLKGEGGKVKAEKDAWGRLISINQPQNIRDGSSLLLTVDHNVQYQVEAKLKEAMERYSADNGSIIVMNPKTGGILAMASYPSYDPNKFNEVATDKQDVFINPAISKVWEPGSILKSMTMGAGLDTKKVEPDTEDVFSNMTVVQGYEIHTAQDKAFGRETMTQVLENSDNVAMVWLADKIGNDELYKYLEKFGFNSKTGIDLSGETNGTMAKLSSWRDITRATISFGQGISLTPLQVLAAYAVIANSGKFVTPYIVDKIIKENGEIITTQPKIGQEVISADNAAKLGGMLVSVVENGHGKKAQVPGYNVAGKTGTAQIPKPEGGYYEDRHVGSFAGFLPAEDPKFAMIVRLENPKNVEWAESSAAPIFGEIAQWLVNYYQIKPTK